MARSARNRPVRAIYDERGNPVGQGRIDKGAFDSIDPQRVQKLKDEAGRAIPSLPERSEPWHDPYQTLGAPRKREKRRTLDDMRRFNEHIKRMQALEEPPRPLLQRALLLLERWVRGK